MGEAAQHSCLNFLLSMCVASMLARRQLSFLCCEHFAWEINVVLGHAYIIVGYVNRPQDAGCWASVTSSI